MCSGAGRRQAERRDGGLPCFLLPAARPRGHRSLCLISLSPFLSASLPASLEETSEEEDCVRFICEPPTQGSQQRSCEILDEEAWGFPSTSGKWKLEAKLREGASPREASDRRPQGAEGEGCSSHPLLSSSLLGPSLPPRPPAQQSLQLPSRCPSLPSPSQPWAPGWRVGRRGLDAAVAECLKENKTETNCTAATSVPSPGHRLAPPQAPPSSLPEPGPLPRGPPPLAGLRGACLECQFQPRIRSAS